MKIRIFPEQNYKGIFLNGKTLRIALDPDKPILELEYPEFYDVKITNKCNGNCEYCYQDSKSENTHFKNILKKASNYFGLMSENERPFQVAIGGGNPNEHPDFIKLLELFTTLDIMPNYTTNGMGMTDEIYEATKKYCGGVAISTHKHLKEYWEPVVKRLNKEGIRVNLHHIISDKKSVDELSELFEKYKDIVDYIVLLPYMVVGRASKKEIDYDALTELLKNIDTSKIAFGANFYEYLKNTKLNLDVSLYEPEIMSKYLDMSDMTLYNSSFNLTEV